MSTPVNLKILTDAVVASYIHEISTRHRPEQSAEDRGTSPSGGERASAAADD